MDLTREEAIRKHRELWLKIAEIITPELLKQCKSADGETIIKEMALEAIGETEIIIHNCYCCAYSVPGCDDCPIEWTRAEGLEGVPCCDGEYGEWYKAAFIDKNVEKAKELALIIANLPEREE